MEKFMGISYIEKKIKSIRCYLLRVNALNNNPEYRKLFYDTSAYEFILEVPNLSYFQDMWTSSKGNTQIYSSDLEMINISIEVSPEGIK
jgi:hypothetical protein